VIGDTFPPITGSRLSARAVDSSEMDVPVVPGRCSFPAWSSRPDRLLIIKPVNAVLGWVFRSFNRLFDMSPTARLDVSKIIRLLVVVMIVYGGLLFLTGFQFVRAPTGFIPDRQGYLILNVQLPDSASVERTQKIMARIEEIAATRPASRTRSASPESR